MTAKISSMAALRAATGKAISLDNLDADFLKTINKPLQPELTAELADLREWFYKELASFMGKNLSNEVDKQSVDEMISYFHNLYGGDIRMYKRFYVARDGKIKKIQKMLKDMLSLRKRVMGDKLVTNVSISCNINDIGNENDEEEMKLIKDISKYWAIEYYGFTSTGRALLTAKLNGIEPGKFIKQFNKLQIEKYYFYFVELGNLLLSISNSEPFKKDIQQPLIPSRLIEVYDFKGISRKQLSLSGLLVLKDVLGLGQILFPEYTEKTMMINTPWYFSASWAIVSVALDKRSRDKVLISRHDRKKEIIELLGDEELAPTLFQRLLEKIK